MHATQQLVLAVYRSVQLVRSQSALSMMWSRDDYRLTSMHKRMALAGAIELILWSKFRPRARSWDGPPCQSEECNFPPSFAFTPCVNMRKYLEAGADECRDVLNCSDHDVTYRVVSNLRQTNGTRSSEAASRVKVNSECRIWK
jgi:hypothetical protein